MIKFQYTIIKMGIEITNKSTEYSYLFTPTAYDKFDPIKANITNDLRK